MANRRSRPSRTCDAPGCCELVRRGMLMCRPHWFATPRPLREAISLAWKEKRIRDWSANCLEARSYHADNAKSAVNTTPQISAAEAYRRNAALLGERIDG